MTADIPDLDALRRFAADTLGSGSVIENRSRAFGRKSVTWRIAAADGTGFYLKRHESPHHYMSEVRALNEWAPLLPAGTWWATPEVVASSDRLGAMIMTELPGELVEDSPPSFGETVEVYRNAGRLARALHGLDVDLSGEARVQRYSPEEVDRYLGPAREFLDAQTCDWAEAILTRPDAWAGLAIVPMHGDYSPRNWVHLRGDPAFKVIDWERARPGFWVEDVQRMTHDHWVNAPHLRDAFFEGYGRSSTDSEWRHANQITLINAIGGVPWAISHGDEPFVQHNRNVIERLKEIL